MAPFLSRSSDAKNIEHCGPKEEEESGEALDIKCTVSRHSGERGSVPLWRTPGGPFVVSAITELDVRMKSQSRVSRALGGRAAAPTNA